jgi:hypothetical protein
MKDQDAKVAESQKDGKFAEMGLGLPYYGACGGAYSYIYTPTSIGLCVSIRNNATKEEQNLTDYSDW